MSESKPRSVPLSENNILVFDTQADKDNYIKEEGTFCFEEYKAYAAAMTRLDRVNARRALDRKRLQFAAQWAQIELDEPPGVV